MNEKEGDLVMRTDIDFTMPKLEKPVFVYTNVTFQDLTWEAQQKVIKAVAEYLQETELYLDKWERYTNDGDFIPEDSEEALYLIATKLAESSWEEWGVDVKHKGVKL